MTDNPTNSDPFEPVDPSEPFDTGVGTQPGSPLPPPASPPSPGPRRLVRDPYTRLGGVASGLANYYGIDVSIVRIIFLLLAFGTGFGFLAYFLAWIIIPRADHWPPGGAAARPFRSLTKRELGLGLAGLGLLVALAFGGGVTGSVLVPLVLVGGGVWLLLQPGNELDEAAFDQGEQAAFSANPGGAPVEPGPPVPPRSRRRRALKITLITFVVLLLLVPIILFGVFIAIVGSGNFDDGVTVSYSPGAVSEFPLDIDHDAGDITVDLTNLDVGDFERLSEPAQLDINVDFGEVTVIVPEGLPVSVDAESTLGDIDLFEQNASGIGNQATRTIGDPVIDIEIDVGAGEVNVVRP